MHTWINVLIDEIWTYEWMNAMSFTSSFNFVCQIYFQCTILMCEMYELWTNKFCMISISKSWNVKFVVNLFNDVTSFSWWQCVISNDKTCYWNVYFLSDECQKNLMPSLRPQTCNKFGERYLLNPLSLIFSLRFVKIVTTCSKLNSHFEDSGYSHFHLF